MNTIVCKAVIKGKRIIPNNFTLDYCKLNPKRSYILLLIEKKKLKFIVYFIGVGNLANQPNIAIFLIQKNRFRKH